MAHTKQQDRKKQMVFNKYWTGRARTLSQGLVCVCPLSKNIPSFSVSNCNNNIVSMRACCSTSVEEQQGCWRSLPESSVCSGNSWTGERGGKKWRYLKSNSVGVEEGKS